MNSEFKVSQYGNLLVYKKEYSRDFIQETIEKHDLNGLKIYSASETTRVASLDFLSEYTFLKDLWIFGQRDFEFGFLASLSQLKMLSISSDGDNVIDLHSQSNIESLTIRWRHGLIKGLEQCQRLKALLLIEYWEENLTNSITSLVGLESLTIKMSTIRSLEGVEAFLLLKCILLGACKRLKSVSTLSGLQHLERLEFVICSRIEDFENLRDLPRLQELRLEDCRVASIGFIQNFPTIKTLSMLGSTTIQDGDLRPAQNIDHVFYKHRKHYNIRIEKAAI